jgi:hypothetical protein
MRANDENGALKLEDRVINVINKAFTAIIKVKKEKLPCYNFTKYQIVLTNDT